MDKSCPLCRQPLPPGPDKLFDLGHGIYSKIKGEVDRGRPGVADTDPWPALSAERQREMDEAVVMLREAADQGHVGAQGCCGCLYMFGCGVAKDERLGFVYTERAARHGLGWAQFNTGVNYQEGKGCDQSYERAAEWFEKAARKGSADAMVNLGLLYAKGQGVPQSYERAAELFKQSAALGHPVSPRDLAHFDLQIFQQTSLVFTQNPPLRTSKPVRAPFTLATNILLTPDAAIAPRHSLLPKA